MRGWSATLHSEVFHFNGPPGDWLTLLEDPSPFQHNGPLHYLFVLANVLPEATTARFHVLPFPCTINRRLNSRPSWSSLSFHRQWKRRRYINGENVINKRRIFVHREERQHLQICVKYTKYILYIFFLFQFQFLFSHFHENAKLHEHPVIADLRFPVVYSTQK